MYTSFPQNPSRDTWNGVIQKFLLFYRKSTESGNFSEEVVWNNGSIKSTPLSKGKLGDLDRFVDYTVRVAMCTSAGCGEPGPKYKILGKTKKGKKYKKES